MSGGEHGLEVLLDGEVLIDDEDAAFGCALFGVHRVGIEGDCRVSEVAQMKE